MSDLGERVYDAGEVITCKLDLMAGVHQAIWLLMDREAGLRPDKGHPIMALVDAAERYGAEAAAEIEALQRGAMALR